jgi:hypothetical protein
MSTERSAKIPWYDRIAPRQREMCPQCHSEQPVYAQLTPRDNYQGRWMLLRCCVCNAPVREVWKLAGEPPREEQRLCAPEQLALFGEVGHGR